MPTYLLFESALGYALFLRNEMEEVALSKIQQTVLDYAKFSAMVKFVSFAPFESPEHGLENANNVSEGELHEFLSNFLDMNLGKVKNVRLGLVESKLGGAIQEHLDNVSCFTDDSVFEMLRGIRLHFHKFVKGVKKGDIEKAQLGLSHAYSRAKIKFNVNKADNMIIQSISMLDQLDKDLNTYTMRTREWYSWHFPELNKLVKDNATYAKLVLLIKDRTSLSEESLDALTEITKDSDLSQQILKLSRSSMGFDTSEYDMINIELFANKIVSLTEYRNELYHYLQQKMHECAPNLSCLLGEQVGARLISRAGSLINLSKMPASTVQILGAEKALFRALKTRGPTPKYGLLFNSSFISKASKANKGKVSRYLANKCSVAVRIDCFQDFPTSKYGEMLRDQVEQRLHYYETGKGGEELKKNIDLMSGVFEEVSKEQSTSAPSKKKEGKKSAEVTQKEDSKKSKKDKKDKKRKRSADEDNEDEAPKKKSKKESKEESSSKKEKKEKKEKKKKEKKDKKDKKEKKKSSK